MVQMTVYWVIYCTFIECIFIHGTMYIYCMYIVMYMLCILYLSSNCIWAKPSYQAIFPVRNEKMLSSSILSHHSGSVYLSAFWFNFPSKVAPISQKLWPNVTGYKSLIAHYVTFEQLKIHQNSSCELSLFTRVLCDK